jgi:hypothetical protein
MQRLQLATGKTILTYGIKRCGTGSSVEKLVGGNVNRQLTYAPNQHAVQSENIYFADEYLATQFGYRSVASPTGYVDSKDTELLKYPIGSNLDILSSPEVQKILSSKVKKVTDNLLQSLPKKSQ